METAGHPRAFAAIFDYANSNGSKNKLSPYVSIHGWNMGEQIPVNLKEGAK